MSRSRRRPSPTSTTQATATVDPATRLRSLAVLGLITACLAGPVGLIISVVALVRPRVQGKQDPIALVGVLVGLATTAAFIGGIFYFHAVLTGQTGICADLGPGTHDGTFGTFTCPNN